MRVHSRDGERPVNFRRWWPWCARGARAMLSIAVLLAIACTADPPYRGRSSDEWIAQLRDPSLSARIDATAALAAILRIHPGSRRVTASLVQALADSSDDVRLAAGNALAQPGVDASDAVAGLIQVAHDSAHAEVRATALRLLGIVAATIDSSKVQPQLDALVRVWVDAVDDSSALVRAASADAIDRMGTRLRPRSAALENMLRNLVHDPEPRMRIRALTILGNVSPRDSLARTLYGLALRDPAVAVREAAVVTAARARPGDSEILPAITAALRDSAPSVRRAAVAAFAGEHVALTTAARVALVQAQADPDSTVRTEATHALARFHQRGGVDALPRVPSVVERCRDLPPRTRGC